MSVSVWGIDERRPVRVKNGAEFPCRIDRSKDPTDVLNWNQGNAFAVLRLLGLLPEDGDDTDMFGQVSIADARRALMVAWARFARVGPGLVREEQTTYGRPVERDGVVVLKPVRVWVGGIDLAYLSRQLQAWGETVEALAGRGATHVCWG